MGASVRISLVYFPPYNKDTAVAGHDLMAITLATQVSGSLFNLVHVF